MATEAFIVGRRACSRSRCRGCCCRLLSGKGIGDLAKDRREALRLSSARSGASTSCADHGPAAASCHINAPRRPAPEHGRRVTGLVSAEGPIRYLRTLGGDGSADIRALTKPYGSNRVKVLSAADDPPTLLEISFSKIQQIASGREVVLSRSLPQMLRVLLLTTCTTGSNGSAVYQFAR